jgi:hypothetical protein
MLPRSSALRCCCGLLFLTLGCSRSAVVTLPENPSRSDEISTVARAQDGEPDAGDFSTPEDAGGAPLAKSLPPKQSKAAESNRPKAVRLSSTSVDWKLPAVTLPPTHSAPPRLPAQPRSSSLRPRLVTAESLNEPPDAPILPQIQALPEWERVRVASADVNEPLSLPILALPVSDRASLDDPTMEASIAAAVSATIPSRTAKAPFLKLTLPDPYDHRRRLTTTMTESEQPLTATPRIPEKSRTVPPR